MESRHLGEIVLDGGVGGGAVDAVVEALGQRLDVRVEIDYPARFNEAVVADIDLVLDQIQYVDDLGRQTIEAGLRRDDYSAPAQLFRAWKDKTGREDASDEEFLKALRPKRLTITPDGGRVNPDRVHLSYELADASVPGQVTVRYVDRTGPELAPAPRSGY